MGFTTINNLNDRPELAKALGNLTVAWSSAERMMYFLFWVSSQTDQSRAYEIYETITSNHTRNDLTKRLLKFNEKSHAKYPDLIEAFNNLLEMQKTRNELVHRTWVIGDDGQLGLLDHRMKAKEPVISVFEESTVVSLVERMNATSSRLINLMQEIYPEAFGKVEA